VHGWPVRLVVACRRGRLVVRVCAGRRRRRGELGARADACTARAPPPGAPHCQGPRTPATVQALPPSWSGLHLQQRWGAYGRLQGGLPARWIPAQAGTACLPCVVRLCALQSATCLLGKMCEGSSACRDSVPGRIIVAYQDIFSVLRQMLFCYWPEQDRRQELTAAGPEGVAASVLPGMGGRAHLWQTPAPDPRTFGRQELVTAGPEGVEDVIRALRATQPGGPPPGARVRRRAEACADGETAEGPAAGTAPVAAPRAASLGPQAVEAHACALRPGTLSGLAPLQASACVSAPPPPPPPMPPRASWMCSGLQEGASEVGGGDVPAPEAGSSAHGPCQSSYFAAGPGQRNSISWVAGTGLGLGAHAAGDPARVWRHAGAVLNLGALQHDGRAPRSAPGAKVLLWCSVV